MNNSTEIPKSTIEWIVNRFHVGTPDETIKADIRKRTKKYRKFGWTEELIQAAENYAVMHHHQNQQLYHSVMTGRF